MILVINVEKIKEIIVVEGKTDTAIIKKLFDADTIETHGLALDEKTLDYIEEVSKGRGIIILTDPDYPGMKIRNRIIERVPEAKHAFVDKKDAIGEKKLGIAEAREDAIVDALKNVVSFSHAKESLSWEDFIDLGIISSLLIINVLGTVISLKVVIVSLLILSKSTKKYTYLAFLFTSSTVS